LEAESGSLMLSLLKSLTGLKILVMISSGLFGKGMEMEMRMERVSCKILGKG